MVRAPSAACRIAPARRSCRRGGERLELKGRRRRVAGQLLHGIVRTPAARPRQRRQQQLACARAERRKAPSRPACGPPRRGWAKGLEASLQGAQGHGEEADGVGPARSRTGCPRAAARWRCRDASVRGDRCRCRARPADQQADRHTVPAWRSRARRPHTERTNRVGATGWA